MQINARFEELNFGAVTLEYWAPSQLLIGEAYLGVGRAGKLDYGNSLFISPQIRFLDAET